MDVGANIPREIGSAPHTALEVRASPPNSYHADAAEPSADEQSVFATEWFELVTRRAPQGGAPHYVVTELDAVTVLAVTEDEHVLVVRQYRPAVRKTTLEFVSGHIEEGETPLLAAERELLEETGHRAVHWTPLGTFLPDSGRFDVRHHCFVATGLECVGEITEEGLRVERIPPAELFDMLATEAFDHLPAIAVLLMARDRGLIGRN